MDLTNLQTIHSILKTNNIYLSKNFGQNFLINKEVLNNIINASEINKNDYIIEVGPGLGCLTYELAKRAKNITTIELDKKLIPILNKNLKELQNIEIINMDALEFPIPNEPYKVVANIPYNITSPLINHFLKDTFMSYVCHFEPRCSSGKNLHLSLPPSLLVLLIQKEVAEKICPKDNKLSVLALNILTFADVEIVDQVNRKNFFPEPEVDSAIIKIKVYDKPKVNCDLKTYFQLIKVTFSQKRKKIKNTLTPLFKSRNLNPDEIFKKSGVDPNKRPEDLQIRDFENLVKNL